MRKLYLIAMVALMATGCSMSMQPAEERFYNKSELFNKSAIYQADAVQEGDAVYLFLQAKDTESAADEKNTLMATVIELDGQTVLSPPVMVSPVYIDKLEKFQSEWCEETGIKQREAGCSKTSLQIKKYYSALSSNKPAAGFMDKFKIKGQQSVVFPSGSKKLKVLLYQSQWAGRGYLATFDIDSLTFLPGEYYFHFNVERGAGGYASKIVAWVTFGTDGRTVWQQVVNK